MPKRVFIAFLAALVLAPAAVDAGQTAGGFTVLGAQRSKQFVSPTRQIRARNEMEDVVLQLRVGGISREDFQKIDRDTVYVMSGDQKLPPTIVATGVIDGKEEILLISVVPRATLGMTLHIGSYAPVPFKADEKVLEVLPEGAPIPQGGPPPARTQPPPATTSPQ